MDTTCLTIRSYDPPPKYRLKDLGPSSSSSLSILCHGDLNSFHWVLYIHLSFTSSIQTYLSNFHSSTCLLSLCVDLSYILNLRCPQYYLDLLSGPSTFPLSWSCKSVPHSPPSFFQQVLPIFSPNICWLTFFLHLHFMTFVQVSNFFHLQPPLLSLLLLYDSFSTLQIFFFLTCKSFNISLFPLKSFKWLSTEVQ